MKRKIIPAIIAFIGLSSLAILGSSPKFVSGILDSVQNNPITRLFSSEVQTESQKTTDGSNGKIENRANFSQNVSMKDAETPPAQVPEVILWRVIFSLPEKLEKAAEKARQAGQDDSLWTNYFVRQGGLSPAGSQALTETSSAYLNEIAPLNEKAKTIAEEWHRKNLSKPTISSDEKPLSKPSPPAELVELQRQKDEIAMRYKDDLRNAVSEEEFAKFSKFVNGDFAKGFALQEGSPPIDVDSQIKKQNNSLTPFNESIPSRKQPTGGNNK
ncbi:MAG: hypothetical protein ACR2MG_09835 [Pyrinomonadaceae bacterium]